MEKLEQYIEGLEKGRIFTEIDLQGQGLGDSDLYRLMHCLEQRHYKSAARLERLNLSNNHLTRLYVSIFSSLRELRANGNQLTDIDVSKPTTLKYVYLANNNLHTVVANRSNLLILDVSYNPEFNRLDCDGSKDAYAFTEILCSEGNRLFNQRLAINFQRRWLTSLHLDNSGLTNIDLSGLRRLQVLTLDHNKLTNIDVRELESLQRLSVTDNELTSIDFANIKLFGLAKISLERNKITSIKNLGVCPKLRYLSVASNALTSIDFSGFRELHLNELHLEHNKLTSINLRGLYGLEILNMDDNELTSVALHYLRPLRTLSIRNNPLAFPPLVLFYGAHEIIDLNIHGNHLSTFGKIVCALIGHPKYGSHMHRIVYQQGQAKPEIGQFTPMEIQNAVYEHFAKQIPIGFRRGMLLAAALRGLPAEIQYSIINDYLADKDPERRDFCDREWSFFRGIFKQYKKSDMKQFRTQSLAIRDSIEGAYNSDHHGLMRFLRGENLNRIVNSVQRRAIVNSQATVGVEGADAQEVTQESTLSARMSC